MRAYLPMVLLVAIGAAMRDASADVVGNTTEERISHGRQQIEAIGRTAKTEAEKRQVLRDLEDLAKAIRVELAESDPEAYARLTGTICGTIQGLDVPARHKLYVAQEYAFAALEKRAGFSLDAQCELVGNLQQDVDARGNVLTGDARAELRGRQARMWLETWKRVVTTIDRNWDPEDRPLGNVPLPRGAEGEAGMAPELIPDPQLRAQYVAAIDANGEKSRTYWLQARARKLEKYWIPRAKRFLIRSYMEEPERTDELQALLEQYVADEKDRTQVLDAVRNKKMPEELEFRATTQKAATQPAQ